MLIVDRILEVLQEWCEVEYDAKDSTQQHDTNPVNPIIATSVDIAEEGATGCSLVDSTRSGYSNIAHPMRVESQRIRNYSDEFLDEFEHLQPAPFYRESGSHGICPNFYNILQTSLNSVKKRGVLHEF